MCIRTFVARIYYRSLHNADMGRSVTKGNTSIASVPASQNAIFLNMEYQLHGAQITNMVIWKKGKKGPALFCGRPSNAGTSAAKHSTRQHRRLRAVQYSIVTHSLNTYY
jgi:hypothetical protein